MDKKVTAAEANRQFSRLLKDVRKGETFTVTSHGEPVARIVPTESKTSRTEARKALFARLKSQPIRQIGNWTRDELYDDDVT
jgi:prevent-host-death family protein